MPFCACFIYDNIILIVDGDAVATRMKPQMDEIDAEIINYIAAHGKANAQELAQLVGITIPSIRYRIFQLIVKGLVSQEKTRDHHVWFFLKNQSESRNKDDEKGNFSESRSKCN
jgi:predicted ArsR family transcriptional regulator